MNKLFGSSIHSEKLLSTFVTYLKLSAPMRFETFPFHLLAMGHVVHFPIFHIKGNSIEQFEVTIVGLTAVTVRYSATNGGALCERKPLWWYMQLPLHESQQHRVAWDMLPQLEKLGYLWNPMWASKIYVGDFHHNML